MKTIQKIGAIIGAIMLSTSILVLVVLSCIPLYCGYLTMTTETVVGGIVLIAIASFMFIAVLFFVFKYVRYLRAQFKACKHCSNKIHQNTSLGGKYIRFTCIDCGESKWSDEIEF